MSQPTVPDTFCALPWMNASLDVDGTIRPCCKFSHQQEDSPYQLGNLKNLKLAEIWNSPGLQKLRADFLKGERPKECQTCWSEEAAGLASFRQTFNEGRVEKIDVDFQKTTVPTPITLDLKLSNVCNLKCRICGPVASSQWTKEELAHGSDSSWFASNAKYFSGNKITGDIENRETFRKWIPQLTHVEMLGGEPLLSRENREIEQMLIDEGRAPEISLSYNTNVTVYRQDLVERWKQFKQVTLCLSLDDIGARLEYQRSPAKWNEVSEHVLNYAQIGHPSIKVVLFLSVSIYNVWYVPEYFEWAAKNCPNIEIHINFVHNDPEFCITNLPDHAKATIAQRLRDAAQGETPDAEMSRRNQSKIPQIIDLLLSQPSRPELWLKFAETTRKIDERRQQDFKSVFPEFSAFAFCGD